MTGTPTISVTDIPDDAVVVDVREPDEWAAGHAPSAVHIPLGDLPARIDELPETSTTLPVVCRSGGRSGQAVQWLVQQGFDVVNVEGGMRAWISAGKTMAGGSEGQEPRVI